MKIFEQYIQTPCELYWRQAAREQLLRMGDEEMARASQAVQWVFVMGCQSGFDLLRDQLIINSIICFLLHSSQEKWSLNSSSEAWGQFIPSDRLIGLKLAGWVCLQTAAIATTLSLSAAMRTQTHETRTLPRCGGNNSYSTCEYKSVVYDCLSRYCTYVWSWGTSSSFRTP